MDVLFCAIYGFLNIDLVCYIWKEWVLLDLDPVLKSLLLNSCNPCNIKGDKSSTIVVAPEEEKDVW